MEIACGAREDKLETHFTGVQLYAVLGVEGAANSEALVDTGLIVGYSGANMMLQNPEAKP